jgi:hypothetical protein
MSYSEENGQVDQAHWRLEGLTLFKRKLIGLIHWWLQLAPIRHQHWCEYGPGGFNDARCEHQSGSWMCEGLFCVGQERKNCPGCEKGKPCKYGSGRNFHRCECGLGGHV